MNFQEPASFTQTARALHFMDLGDPLTERSALTWIKTSAVLPMTAICSVLRSIRRY